MKYKVGDKVRVRSDLDVLKCYNGLFFMPDMERLRAKIVTIDAITETGRYEIKEDAGAWRWTDEMFMPVTFTKSNLETGLVVEYRDGKRRMVIGNGLIDSEGGSVHNLTENEYEDDLTDTGTYDFDICKVYEVSPNFCGDLDEILNADDTDNLILIWEREEPPKKMTVAEIEAALGHKVEVVAEVEE